MPLIVMTKNIEMRSFFKDIGGSFQINLYQKLSTALLTADFFCVVKCILGSS